MSQSTLELSSRTAGSRQTGRGCFHCGEPCAADSFSLEGKSFCCFGCQTVFGLLQANGLGQFYELNARPGVRVRGKVLQAKWAFLDDPHVQEKLLDYSDRSRAKVTLHLPAIHCVACVWLLENLFKLHPGVGQSLVNFPRREAAVTFYPDRIKFSELAALLASIGYEPEFTLASGVLGLGSGKTPRTPAPGRHTLAQRSWLQIGLAGFAFGNIMLMSLPFYFGLDSFNGPWFKNIAGWLGLIFALPVVTFSAADFWRAAWFGVRQRVLTMEVPIVLGLTAIYAASTVEVFSQRGPGYCDSLCGLIFFLLCGRLFQKKTHEWLTFDRDYRGFFPLSVVRKTAAGEETIAISRLQPGDRILLRNGELLPADAKLVSGQACLDYSFVTGESEPVASVNGAHLFAGGRQVGGAIEVETIKPVAQSYLAALWNNEAFSKPKENDLNSLTNRFSKRFTKLVVGVALAAAACWFVVDETKFLKVFISVLIVACPCALALAAPLTHGTAQRILARLKIFLKNAAVIERLAEVDAVVLDKTGTLTSGDVCTVEFAAPARLSAAESLMIASLTRHSTHPNSVCITRWLPAASLPVAGFLETPGGGIEGEIAGSKIRLGSRAWLTTNGVAVPGGNQELDSGSEVCVAMDGRFRGMFKLENSLRPEVEQLVSQLGANLELALLSGDNEREAVRFKGLFGGRAILKFNQSPLDKLNFIRELQRRGRKVMMVGDGLNDAGALRQAEIGVAVVEQIGVFSPASDVILDAAELFQLERVLQFSRQAARIVRYSFAISAIYNVFGVSIAAAGLLSPLVCAILMPLSSVTVVAFACGATTWAGRKLAATIPNSAPLSTCDDQPAALEAQLLSKEAA